MPNHLAERIAALDWHLMQRVSIAGAAAEGAKQGPSNYFGTRRRSYIPDQSSSCIGIARLLQDHASTRGQHDYIRDKI